jgi:hypothetical protein
MLFGIEAYGNKSASCMQLSGCEVVIVSYQILVMVALKIAETGG